jgi:hypothetical protein
MAQTKKQKQKIDKVMGEFKAGTLESGSGKKVTSKDQAIAIALSEAGAARKMNSGGMCGRPTGQGYRSSRKPEGMV